ncbi:hypothetical protein CKO42_23335, partial [Lamprobacter modestohalophilus]
RDGPVFVSLCHWSAPLPWLTMGSHHRLLCPLGVCWRSGADHSITEGSAAHTLPGGKQRQANEPTTGVMPQHESPLTGIAPLKDEIDPLRPFTDLDLDRDGVLTPNEAHASPRIGSDWRRLDTNNDGVIDRSEWNLVVEDPPPTTEEANR